MEMQVAAVCRTELQVLQLVSIRLLNRRK